MDIGKYKILKAAGRVTLQKYGADYFQCIQRKFNPDTGSEIAPEIATFTSAELVKQKESLEETLAAVNELLTDMQAASAA